MEISIEPILSGCPYSQFRPPTIQFCESNLCSYITQPANTISNLFFILVSYWIFFVKQRNSFFLSFGFAISSFLIGLFSTLYHASFTFFMQFFDLSSMFLFASFILVLNLYRLELIPKKMIFFGTGLLTVLCALALLNWKRYGIFIFANLIIFVIFTELILKLKYEVVYKNFLIGLALLSIGFIFWILDYSRIWCNPNNHWIQGHAVWHTLTALCIYFVFLFYEENLDSNVKTSF